jgi:hypothetical protein
MRLLLRPLALWVRYWPQLAACYLLGYLARRAAIEAAAWLGHDNDLWVSLIMPLAGLARLGSYVAMFLVLRSAFPILATLAARPARRMNLFSTVIVPFFAIYLAWQMFREDWLAFEARALDYRVTDAITATAPTELHPDSLPVGTLTWVVIAVALVTRWALNRYRDRLPGVMVIPRIYVDALWVFLVLSFSVNQGLQPLLNPGGWVARRRVVVWFADTRAALFSHFAPLEAAWDALMWSLRTVFGGAAVPLLWLAVAGIVYGVSLNVDWRTLARRVAGDRAAVVIDRVAPLRQQVQSRWARIPKTVQDRSREHAEAQIGRFRPIIDSARIVLNAGVLVLAGYVLAYLGLAWLDMAGSFYRAQLGDGYLFRGMAWLIGPQPSEFWKAYTPILSLVSHLIIEPLRICLVASTFVYCLERATALDRPATAAAAP